MKKEKSKNIIKLDKTIEKTLKDLGVVRLTDTDTHVNRMEIRSETSNRLYIVSQRLKKDGTIQNECSCPGWIFKRHCKHLEVMGPVLEQIASSATPLRGISKNSIKNLEYVPPTSNLTKPKKIKLKKGSVTPDYKDVQRIEDIVTKSGGDTKKMLELCEKMAKSIKNKDKAQRRATAAKQNLPKSIAKKAFDIFWQD